jgi:hypothetical protein
MNFRADGLRDRSSRPHSLPSQTPPATAQPSRRCAASAHMSIDDFKIPREACQQKSKPVRGRRCIRDWRELVVEGEGGRFVEAVGVIGFKYLLRPVIKLAITNQYPKAAGSEVGTGLGRKTFHHSANADFIVRAAPRRPFSTAPNERLSSQSVQPMISTSPGLQVCFAYRKLRRGKASDRSERRP